MKKVRKAIIPAAGLGTRFLPATKAQPKEMLPIIDTPTIQFIVEEAIDSGIEDIIIVTGKGKRAIEDHFDKNIELEENLIKNEKYYLLDKIKRPSEVDIHYIRQKEAIGLGHAIWVARKFIQDEPFGVLLGDDIIQAETPGLRQLIEQYEKVERSIVGVQQIPEDEIDRYGIVESGALYGESYEIKTLVEKPKVGTVSSNLAIMGRYVLTPKIFEYLGNLDKGIGGEIQLTDALRKLNEEEKVYAYPFEGQRYDVGEKLGFIKTNIEFALKDKEIGDEVREFLKEICE